MKKQLVFLLSVVFATATFAQNKSVGIGTTTPNLNAALDVVSPTNNQGLLVPRLTTTQRTAMTSALGAADKGLMVFDITGNSFAVWNGNSWGITLAGSSTDGLAALFGATTGTSAAGFFQNSNAANISPTLYSTTNGTGNAIAIRGDITNASNAAAAVYGSTNGTGVGLYGITSGAGAAIQGYTTTGVAAIYGQHDGASNGNAGLFSITNAANNFSALRATTIGGGAAGDFIINNTASNNAAVRGTTNGTGTAINGTSTSNQNSFAGLFANTDPANTFPAIQARSQGSGSAGVRVIQNSTSLGRGMDIIMQNPTSTAEGLNVNSQGLGFAANFNISNTASTFQAIKARTVGTAGAARFETSNTAGTNPNVETVTDSPGGALRSTSTGAGYSGWFEINNTANSQFALRGATSGTGTAVWGQTSSSTTGSAGVFETLNATNTSPVVQINVAGTGNALQTLGKIIAGGVGVSNPTGGDGVFSQLSGSGSGMAFSGFSNGTNSGCGGFYLMNNANPRDAMEVLTFGTGSAAIFSNGIGSSAPTIKATTNVGGTGSTILLNHTGASGNIAVFQSGSNNVARIDKTGKGFFNGGTQNSGADVAEMFEVEGAKNTYEPGDVMVISEATDRTMEKSFQPNSTKVAGVYATKPGVILTEKSSEENTDQLVPVGVIGVIPTKVCGENGSIKRGDLLVTSSLKGHAMKAISKNGDGVFAAGVILGKALENFDGNGAGVIKVLVNVK